MNNAKILRILMKQVKSVSLMTALGKAKDKYFKLMESAGLVEITQSLIQKDANALL